MKRIGHLLEQAASFENLMRSFRLARKGCGDTPAACRFFFYLEPELLRLQKELLSGDYRPGRYRYFRIRDPKERSIAVAPFRDRVVHHAIVQVLTPIYERVFIFDSYATRPGKGTHAAIRRAQQFLRRWRWYWKTDIVKYFDSVDHDILLDILQRKIKDRALLVLLERIIRNTPVPGKGLPIGNLTSQFLANVYLDRADHAIKEEFRVKGYLRYMDDLVLFDHEKEPLRQVSGQVEALLDRRLGLRLNARATMLNTAQHGLSWLGMRIFPQCMRVRPENRRQSLKRLKRRVEEWKAGKIDEYAMQQCLSSIVGHLRYFCPDMAITVGVDADEWRVEPRDPGRQLEQ